MILKTPQRAKALRGLFYRRRMCGMPLGTDFMMLSTGTARGHHSFRLLTHMPSF